LIVQRAAQDLHIVRVVQIVYKSGSGRQVFEILGQALAASTAALVVFHRVEKALEDVVRSVHESPAATCLGGKLDFVAPQVLAVLSEVAEHGVDGLSGIFRGTALGAPGFERFGQLLDLLADVAKRCRLLFGR
jgi:hypothetical protein